MFGIFRGSKKGSIHIDNLIGRRPSSFYINPEPEPESDSEPDLSMVGILVSDSYDDFFAKYSETRVSVDDMDTVLTEYAGYIVKPCIAYLHGLSRSGVVSERHLDKVLQILRTYGALWILKNTKKPGEAYMRSDFDDMSWLKGASYWGKKIFPEGTKFIKDE